MKRFLSDVQDGTVPVTLWLREEVGDNQEGKQDLKRIFNDSKTPFDTPKPSRLIERILQISTNKDDIILDSFAGSGTTAHAVLNLNKQDGGNRKFIMIEMEDYADTITAERVRRVINGYSDKEGIEGSFDYYELGQALFLEDGNLNEAVGVSKIRAYIYYTETQRAIEPVENADNEYYLGNANDTAYYFYYEPESITTLDYDFLANIKTRYEQYVIYADNCVLTKEFMVQHYIIFKKIPRDITRF